MLDPVFRIGGWIARALGRDQDGIEMVLRGRVLGGSRKWLVGRHVRFVGPCKRFCFGSHVCFYGNIYLNANGLDGYIKIGEGTHIDQFCVLYGQGGLTIGKHCAIASNAIIYTQTNAEMLKDRTPVSPQSIHYARIIIGDGCWLGAGVRILPGITIGEGAHIGAGAVIICDIPPKVVAAGVPAQILGIKAK
jgi:acetyltransferase-like isoleucine patch superfamily enzyme